MNENVWIPIKISLKFVPKGLINNISSFVQIMAWRRPGDKPLSELMIISLPTYICVARPQLVERHIAQYDIIFEYGVNNNMLAATALLSLYHTIYNH